MVTWTVMSRSFGRLICGDLDDLKMVVWSAGTYSAAPSALKTRRGETISGYPQAEATFIQRRHPGSGGPWETRRPLATSSKLAFAYRGASKVDSLALAIRCSSKRTRTSLLEPRWRRRITGWGCCSRSRAAFRRAITSAWAEGSNSSMTLLVPSLTTSCPGRRGGEAARAELGTSKKRKAANPKGTRMARNSRPASESAE